MTDPRTPGPGRALAVRALVATALVATMCAVGGWAAPAGAQVGSTCGLATRTVPPYFTLTTLVGSATVRDGAILLTDAELDQAGAAWTGRQVDVTGGFTATFRFSIPGDGADGIAFVVQAADGAALGDPGAGIGYQGIPRSVAVELDTWQNSGFDFPSGRPDPNANHVSIQTRGLQPNSADPIHSRATRTSIPFLSDGQAHRVMVDYQGTRFRVFLDGGPRPLIDWQVDLADRIGGPAAWLGLTAATGAAAEQHLVHSFVVCR